MKKIRAPNKRECIYMIKNGCKMMLLFYLFFRSVILAVAAFMISTVFSYSFAKKESKEHRINQLNLEFREGLQGIASALSTGYSIENSFAEATKDLKLLYGDKSVLAPEFEALLTKLSMNCSVEMALLELAKESEVEDIQQFSDIFQTAKRTGGDLIAITHNTADRISEKIEVQREIATMISGKEMEAKIMTYIPLGIIAYFWVCSPGFLDVLYGGIGKIIMGVLLCVYLFASNWSRKICRINV